MPASYSELYDRIEERYSIDEIDSVTIAEFMIADKNVGPGTIRYGFNKKGEQRYAKTQGISSRGLSNIRNKAEEIGRAGEIYREATETNDIRDVRRLKGETPLVYRREVTNILNRKEEELSKILEEKKIQVEAQAIKEREIKSIENRKVSIGEDINNAKSLDDLRNIRRRIDNLEGVIPNSDIENLRDKENEKRVVIREENIARGFAQRELKREQRARIQATGEGVSPDF